MEYPENGSLQINGSIQPSEKRSRSTFKRLKLSYNKIKQPDQISDRHIKELKIALDIKTKELEKIR